MWTDPIVEEIRAIRHEHAEKFGGNVAAIFADIRQRERESGRVFVTFAQPKEVMAPNLTLSSDSSPTHATS